MARAGFEPIMFDVDYLLAALSSSRLDPPTGPVGATILILAVAAVGAWFAYTGYRAFRASRLIRDPVVAEALIERLYQSGSAWNRYCYAEVSFYDSSGTHRAATIGIMPRVFVSLREGTRLRVTYSAAMPETARFGGNVVQAVSGVSGAAIMVIGGGLALFMLLLLIAGWAHWIDLTPFRDPHSGMLPPLPPPKN